MIAMSFSPLDIFTEALPFARFIVAVFVGILFIQSGLDKVFDWKGNLSWLNDHFSQSPLARVVPLMLGTVTVVECLAGFVSVAGAIGFLFTGDPRLAMIGAQLAALGLTMLFFGQRVAKDYAGAASLVPYFLLAVAGVLLNSNLWG
jgi:uncharacterized membrane protein YphA (DoxX/SURF4 family)